MTRQIYLDSSHPQEFELSRRSLYFLTTVPGDQRPGIYYSDINTLLFITVVSDVGTIPLFCHNLTLILIDVSSRQFSNIFGREKICFLSFREDIWRVVAFNGVLIYFGSYVPYLFFRLSIISGYLLYWPNPLFVITAHTITVLLFMMCFWHILHISLTQFRRTTTVQIWRVYWSTFLAHLTRRVMCAIAITWRSSSVVNLLKNLLLWNY